MGADWLHTPCLEDRHRARAAALEGWCARHLPADHADLDGACRGLAAGLGRDGWLDITAPGAGAPFDLRALCLTRAVLAYHDGLADFAFAMQGLGTGAISLFGTPEHRAHLTATRAGETLAAFALTEPGSGSDAARLTTRAERLPGGDWRLEGEKTYISNGGIAGLYTVFARTGEEPGARGISAFLMPGDAPGLEVAGRIDVIAPHPLAHLRLNGVILPEGALIGPAGGGFKVAMSVLDVFRTTVGAAALGLARRALDEALGRVRTRRLFGAPMGDLQMVQGHLADMALEVETATQLIWRAAWLRDTGQPRITRQAAMAKLHATEAAQRVADTAVQLFGGDGVRAGETVERLYREVRALRIYEGASDVQRIVIARSLLAEGGGAP